VPSSGRSTGPSEIFLRSACEYIRPTFSQLVDSEETRILSYGKDLLCGFVLCFFSTIPKSCTLVVRLEVMCCLGFTEDK
jgi:hypothetical protein